MAQLVEKSAFAPDEAETSIDKNDALADLLKGAWNRRNVVSIRRIEIGSKGWELVYRP